MKDFRKNNSNGSDRNEGFDHRESRDNRGGFNKFKGPREGGSSRGDVMHKAVCSECGRSCEVPFIPSGNKPVYCSDCFGKKKEGQSRNFEKRDFAPRPPHAMHDERPHAHPAPRDTRIDDLKAQIDTIGTKLDRMMKILMESKTEAVAPVVKETPKEFKKVAPVVKKVVAKAPVKTVAKAKPVAKKKK